MPAVLSREQARAADRVFLPYALAGLALLIAARAVTFVAEQAGRSISPSVGIVLFIGSLAAFCAGFYMRNRRRRRFLGEGA